MSCFATLTLSAADFTQTFSSAKAPELLSDSSVSLNPKSDSANALTQDSLFSTTEYPIYFPVGKTAIHLNYLTNRAMLDSLSAAISRAQADDTRLIQAIEVGGTASPEGNLDYNRKLARKRRQSLQSYLVESLNIDPAIIRDGDIKVMWDELRNEISLRSIDGTDRLLAICSEGSDYSVNDNNRRIAKLKRHNDGKSWKIINKEILPGLRRASAMDVTLILVDRPLPEVEETVVEESVIAPFEPVYDEEDLTEPDDYEEVVSSGCNKEWRLSTNALEWGMLISNIQGEWDFNCHWSANLSLHFSALNYDTRTRKFRTFIFRPEVRFWPGMNHNGFFIDGHVQMAAYNFALPSWHYRIQDVDGKHPALGGGVGIGYRLPLGSGRWALEAAIGAGVYHLKYDRFENRPNGQLVDTRSRTWFGIDNVAISVVFNLSNPNRR